MSKLTEAQEKFGAKHKLMGELLEQAGADHDFSKVTVFGDDLDTQAKVEKFRELNTELADLGAECKRLELQAAGENWHKFQTELEKPAHEPVHPGGPEGKSVGQRVVESPEWKDFSEDRSKDLKLSIDDFEIKTLFDTTAGYAPESTRTGMVVPYPTRPIQVLDLIPTSPTSQAAVVYMEETTATHSTAEKAEGAAFAESTFSLTERSSQVRKITDSVPVTDEQLEDVEGVAGYLNQRLMFGCRQRLDYQVINGTGVPPLLRGILNVNEIQTQAKGTDPRFDAIHKAMTAVRVTGRAIPGATVLHPTDWESIRLTRTADGIYIMGNPAVAGPMTLFGVPVAMGDLISQGTGLVGDFQNFCAIRTKRGIVIETGYDSDDFTTGSKHIRASFRVAFVVYRPTAFCSVTGL